MRLPRLDMTFRLAASAINILINNAAGRLGEAGDDEPGVAALRPASTRAMMRSTPPSLRRRHGIP
jgi:hypothetical protein